MPSHDDRSTVPTPRPLDGVLVVALEQAVAAPYCSSRLADAGARVIKIERAKATSRAATITPFTANRRIGSGSTAARNRSRST